MSAIHALTTAVRDACSLLRQRQTDLLAAHSRASAALSRETVLAGRPDLLAKDFQVRDLAARQANYEEAKDQLQHAREHLLAEARQRRPFHLPGLVKDREYLKWLIEELERWEGNLEPVLADQRLRAEHRDFIQRHLIANRRRWVPLHSLFWGGTEKCRMDTTGGHDAWTEQLRGLRQQKDQIDAAYGRQAKDYENDLAAEIAPSLLPFLLSVAQTVEALEQAIAASASQAEIEWYYSLRVDQLIEAETRRERDLVDEAQASLDEAEQQEREHHKAHESAWWGQLGTRPITELLPKLTQVPLDKLDAVLDWILQMPANDEHIHSNLVHAFLLEEAYRYAGSGRLLAPVMVALIGHCVIVDPPQADRLLGLLPSSGPSQLMSLVDYLRFVRSRGPDLCGVSAFHGLTPADIFLGACYYGKGNAAAALSSLTEWDYTAVEAALAGADRDRSRQALNDFRVQGLQPRIAENAFREVVGRLNVDDAVRGLRDLNCEVLYRLPQPWSLRARPVLPRADWADASGQEYDVKSNLFYRSHSHQGREGLRGFLINLPLRIDAGHAYPGIIFTKTSDRDCTWTYVGTYLPTGRSPDRVLPFFFRLPDSCRFTPAPVPNAECLAPLLLPRHELILGWQLALRRFYVKYEGIDRAEALLDCLIEICAGRYREEPLEVAMWKAVTLLTVEGCSTVGSPTVLRFLDLTEQIIRSPAFPLRLPYIHQDPLLCRWIDQVLRPLAANWETICCPSCGQDASRHTLGVQVTRMTAGGAIEGCLECSACGAEHAGVTILTHCHGCRQYPLVIGQNTLCPLCLGLVCLNDHGNIGGNRSRCKRECNGNDAQVKASNITNGG